MRPRRIHSIWILIAVVTIAYLFRLYWLQILHSQVYADEAIHQYANLERVFDRGTIFFKSKDNALIAAASLETGFILAINPSLVQHPEEAYTLLSSVITLEKEKFILQASKKNDRYEEIAHRVSEKQIEAIRALALPYVITERETWRFYPGGRLASHLLGFVGYSGNDFSGRYGLERYYEDTLSRTGKNLYQNFFSEIFSKVKDTATRGAKGDIVSSIEPRVQASLEHTLENLASTYHPEVAGGVIINPQNGEIYALASTPNFDPNTYSREANSSIFSNPIVERVYEMGSIVKPLTMAIGLDTRVLSATTTYHDYGSLNIDGATISNFDHRGRGVVTMQEVLNQSLNTGAVFVEQRIGNKTFATYLRKLGLGEETGIDLPTETHGLIENLNSPRNIEFATASYGQGIALTPIATVRALSTLANGGWLVTPHIVSSVRYAAGMSRELASDDRVRILQSSTSEEISRMLVSVYDHALLNGTVKMENYSIAAKTGTAQIAKKEGGGYYEDRYLHAFFGYFPAYDPKFLVFFYALNPEGARYASETLTRPFVDTTKFLISYYNIPPDR